MIRALAVGLYVLAAVLFILFAAIKSGNAACTTFVGML